MGFLPFEGVAPPHRTWAPSVKQPLGEVPDSAEVDDDRGRELRGQRPPRLSILAPSMGEWAFSDTEADEMEEHLRGLGYIE